jgi:hypothetical protein
MQISGNPRSKLLLGLAVLGQRVKVKTASFAENVVTSASFDGVPEWLYHNSCLVSATVLANTLSSDIQLESYLESRVVLCPKESC